MPFPVRGAGLALVAGLLSVQPLAGQVARLVIEPDAATLIAGNRLQFQARAYDAAGTPLPATGIRWMALPPDAVTVDSLGIVTAWHSAEARIVAMAGGHSASARLRIEPRDPASIELQAEHLEIPVGGTTRLRAVARDVDLMPLEGPVFTFRSSDDRVATVSPAGVVTGRGEGSAIFAVQVGSLRREVQVRVVAARVARLSVSGPAQTRVGDVIRLRAIAEDRRNLPVADPPVQWSAADADASIDADGAFLAERPGTYRVVVTSAGAAGHHMVRVTPRETPQLATEVPTPHGLGVGLRAVHVAGSTLFAVGRTNRVDIYDVSDPATPRLVDSIVVAAQRIRGLAVDTSLAIGVITAEGEAGLTVVGLRDPTRPTLLAAMARQGLGAVALDDGHAFIAESGTGALRVINVETPDAPREVAVWRLAAPAGVEMPTHRILSGVMVQDGLAYLAYGRDGVVILDVGNGIREGAPDRPRFVSQLVYAMVGRYPPTMQVGVTQVVQRGEYLFVAERAALPEAAASGADPLPELGTVRVVRVRDTLAPELVATFGGSDEVRHVLVDGESLVVSAGPDGVRIVDVRGELRGNLAVQQREVVMVLLDDARVVGSAAVGPWLYLADLRRGLRVVQRPAPEAP